MRSLLCLVLLVVLSVRNDAQLLKKLNLPKNTPLADPNLNTPALIDPLIDVDEFLETLGGDEPTLGQNRADPNLQAPIDLLIGADEKADINRANIDVGSTGSGGNTLYRINFHREGIPNTERIVNINVRGTASTRITGIRATEQGTFQNARATITAGGLGSNSVSIRLTSASSGGLHYIVQVWG